MKIALIPAPRKKRLHPGCFLMDAGTRLAVQDRRGLIGEQTPLFLRTAIGQSAGLNLLMKEGPKRGDRVIELICDEAFRRQPEGYSICVKKDRVSLRASTDDGMFYAIQTFRQILAQTGRRIPCMDIEDWPDFRKRGVYHDITRGKVPKLAVLKKMVETLSCYKINEFSLYIEDAFHFKSHPKVGKGSAQLSANDLMALDAHCKKHHMEFVPSLQSFGHMIHLLKWPEYRHLAESSIRYSLSPAEPDVYRVLDDMYGEFLPLFASKNFNMCGDETVDLAREKSRGLAEKIGKGGVYLRHVLAVQKLAAKYGKKMMMWGDIILNYPETLRKLPRDITCLNWGYAADHDFDGTNRIFEKAGLSYYVCPATAAWLSVFPRLREGMANIKAAAASGKKHGALGLLCTDWGDTPHTNFPGYSWFNLVYAAEQGWNVRASSGDFGHRFSRLFFGDKSGAAGKAIALLGGTYEPFHSDLQRNYATFLLFYSDPLRDLAVVNEHEKAQGFATVETDISRQVRERSLKTAERLAAGCLALLSSAKDRIRENRDSYEEILFAARQTLFMCGKIRFTKEFHEGGLSQKARRRLAETGAVLLGELAAFRREFERLWQGKNQRLRIDDVLRRYDEVETGLRRMTKLLETGRGR
ncbi:MAG: glycoside hydrolase family 20 zincin-like fold domain-containing protein [Verrucomicrobiae bacterium]|nr:glycoside hydrolase family 20 zincin-like fold domain-containing protein [Verrucomicrobiae bacterium]